DRCLTIFLDHRDQISLTDLAGADERVEIALLVTAGAHVGENHVEHVAARFAPVPNLHRRNAQALRVNVLRGGVAVGGNRAADISQAALFPPPTTPPRRT